MFSTSLLLVVCFHFCLFCLEITIKDAINQFVRQVSRLEIAEFKEYVHLKSIDGAKLMEPISIMIVQMIYPTT